MAEFQAELRAFSKRLESLNNHLEMMKKAGVNEDLLIAYLCHNLKISEKKAREILNTIEEFYNKLLKSGMAKSITEVHK